MAPSRNENTIPSVVMNRQHRVAEGVDIDDPGSRQTACPRGADELAAERRQHRCRVIRASGANEKIVIVAVGNINCAKAARNVPRSPAIRLSIR